ncbi:hypothetical protein J4405_05240 [Candidatus Woesearchaeota archaeon]|nr:hypothetical protein [Candidatus Woesearchaeota archaeon]
MKMEEKTLTINLKVKDGNISTGIQSKNISPQEVIGLLEMVKDQFLEKLRKNRKDIFNVEKKDND